MYFSILAHIIVSGTVQSRYMQVGTAINIRERMKIGDLLHHTINMRWGKGGDAVPQDCCIPPLQQHTKASPQVVDSLALVLPGVTSQCCHILDFPVNPV